MKRTCILLTICLTLIAGMFRILAPIAIAGEPQDNVEAMLNESQEALRTGRYDQAITLLKRALSVKPDSARANFDLAYAYIKLGRFALAIEPAKEAVRLDPTNVKARLSLGYAYEFTRQFDLATAAYQQAIKIDPNSPLPYNNLGAMAGRRGRHEEEVEWYKQAIKLDPNFDMAQTNLGMALLKLGRWDEGIESFKQALRANPDNFKANYFLAGTYWRKGQFEEAIEAYNQVLRLNPKERVALRTLPLAQFCLGRGDVAASASRNYIELFGWRDESAPFMALLAHFGLRRAQQQDEARKVLDEATLHCDKNSWPFPLIQFLRSEITAGEALERANNTDKLTEAHAYLGLDCALSGKRDEALEHFNWVREYGNRQFVEYPIALAEIKRLTNQLAAPPKR